jgi:type I restriction enzyme S subunit
MVVPRFGSYQLKRTEELLRDVAPSATLPILTQNDIGDLAFALPPSLEQRVICEYLDRETDKIDSMIRKVEAAIARLREYRAALITAAVTGKFDLREVTLASEPAMLVAAG